MTVEFLLAEEISLVCPAVRFWSLRLDSLDHLTHTPKRHALSAAACKQITKEGGRLQMWFACWIVALMAHSFCDCGVHSCGRSQPHSSRAISLT